MSTEISAPKVLGGMTGYKLLLYPNRLEFESGVGMFTKREAIPLRSISDVQLTAWQTKLVVITQDGRKHEWSFKGAKEAREAILAAL